MHSQILRNTICCWTVIFNITENTKQKLITESTSCFGNVPYCYSNHKFKASATKLRDIPRCKEQKEFMHFGYVSNLRRGKETPTFPIPNHVRYWFVTLLQFIYINLSLYISIQYSSSLCPFLVNYFCFSDNPLPYSWIIYQLHPLHSYNIHSFGMEPVTTEI
jgi:hypothetical protein